MQNLVDHLENNSNFFFKEISQKFQSKLSELRNNWKKYYLSWNETAQIHFNVFCVSHRQH